MPSRKPTDGGTWLLLGLALVWVAYVALWCIVPWVMAGVTVANWTIRHRSKR